MCGVSTTLGTLSSAGVHLGLALEHVQRRRRDAALAPSACGQCRVVDDAAARDIGQRGARISCCASSAAPMAWCDSAAEYGSTITRWSDWRQQLVLGDIAWRRPRRFQLGRQAAAVVIDHRHAEAQVHRGAQSRWPMRPMPRMPSVAPCTSRADEHVVAPFGSTRRGAGNARSRPCGARWPSSARSRSRRWSRSAHRACCWPARRARCRRPGRCCCSRLPYCRRRFSCRAGIQHFGVDALAAGDEGAGLALQASRSALALVQTRVLIIGPRPRNAHARRSHDVGVEDTARATSTRRTGHVGVTHFSRPFSGTR